MHAQVGCGHRAAAAVTVDELRVVANWCVWACDGRGALAWTVDAPAFKIRGRTLNSSIVTVVDTTIQSAKEEKMHKMCKLRSKSMQHGLSCTYLHHCSHQWSSDVGLSSLCSRFQSRDLQALVRESCCNYAARAGPLAQSLTSCCHKLLHS